MARTNAPRVVANNNRPGQQTAPVLRRCWECGYPLTPTNEVSAKLRFWVCDECGCKQQWADYPNLDGSAAEQHLIERGQYSCLSMLSDPDCRVFGGNSNSFDSVKRKFCNPFRYQNGEPIFATDENDRITHRWHWGRMEWVRRERV
jgi:hypothetical protein